MSYGNSRERELEQALRLAQSKLKEQDEVLQSLAEQAKPIVQIVDVDRDGKSMTIANGPGLIRVNRPPGKNVKVGDLATLLQQSGQVDDVYTPPSAVGMVVTVKSVLPGRVEIETPGGAIVVRCGMDVKPGHRVIVDKAFHVVLDVIGPPETKRKFSLERRVNWDDVGGNDSAKRALREAIEVPYQHREVFSAYGKKPVKGVLLYGPPGCGKTLLAQAAATALADLHGEAGEAGFIYVKGPELLSKWVGESESAIRELFTSAREHKRRHGHPALLFIDEADAILGRRNSGDRQIMTGTMVPQFLSEMDGLEDSGCMVLLATNRPDALDAAVVRDGRVDRRVKVERPNLSDTETIAGIYLKDKPSQLDFEDLAAAAALEIFKEDRIVRKLEQYFITVGDFVSGAMVAGVIDQATTKAMMRDVESKRKKPSGLTLEDITWAVDQVQQGLANIDHTDAFKDKYKGE